MISLGSSFEARSVQRNASGYERNLIRIRAVQGQRMGLSLLSRDDIGGIKPIDFAPIMGIREVDPHPCYFRESDSG